MGQFSRSIVFWLILLMLFMTLYSVMKGGGTHEKEISYSDFLTRIEEGELESVVIEGSRITGKLRNTTAPVRTTSPQDD